MWHPIISNTSTVYSATLFILGAVSSLIMWYEKTEQNPSIFYKIKLHIPFALFISATITLKTTMSLYVVMFFFFDFFVGLLLSRQKKPFILTYVATGFVIILMTTPWILVFYEKVLAIFYSMAGNSYDSTVAPADVSIGTSLFFNNIHLYWGGRLYWFLFIFLLLAASSIIALVTLSNKKELPKSTLWTIPLISVSLSITIYYFLTATVLPWGHEINHSVRYTTPGLLACVPLLPFLLHFLSSSYSNGSLNNSLCSYSLTKQVFIPAAQILLIIYIGMFSPLFVDRIQKLQNDNTMIAYMSKNARKHTLPTIKAMSSAEHKNEIKNIQALVPEGEKILVWISTPFQMDFSRNQIEYISSVATSWNKSLGDDEEKALKSFKKDGIGYIFWQYAGYSMRGRSLYESMANSGVPRAMHEGQYGLYYWDTIDTLQKNSEVLYLNTESKYALFKLK
ncbi:MAG: hypothetical protein HQL71_05815 [Magnetococcales bacterium]|nr:hypothetical protein [Magnetococcales bacterium]